MSPLLSLMCSLFSRPYWCIKIISLNTGCLCVLVSSLIADKASSTVLALNCPLQVEEVNIKESADVTTFIAHVQSVPTKFFP